MDRQELAIDPFLRTWSTLNDVSFFDVSVSSTRNRGNGLVTLRKLTTAAETHDVPILLSVPTGIILNAEAVEQYAKQDKNFRQLLDDVGHQSTRLDILLFSLAQLILNSSKEDGATGASGPWTGYIKFLPGLSQLPVPSLWNEAERTLLRGTSLEVAVNAKLAALEAEYDSLLAKVSGTLTHWETGSWISSNLPLRHWFLMDAWYRSRCLELPKSGEAMVPCIDMVNHSAQPNAYYDENTKDEVVLLLRPDKELAEGDEITISYGEKKSAAEMLFSYGFIDPDSCQHSLILPLEPFPDDPLGKAKTHIFKAAPTIRLRKEDGGVSWECPFAYLLCVNEEDGLEFRVIQETDGGRSLRMFWKDVDVSEKAVEFATVIEADELAPIIQLRVVTVIQDTLATHLQKMESNVEPSPSLGIVRDECRAQANLLLQIEGELISQAVDRLEQQKSELLLDDKVIAYLGAMDYDQEEKTSGPPSDDDEDDFS